MFRSVITVFSAANMCLASCKWYSNGTEVSLIMSSVAKFMGSAVVVMVTPVSDNKKKQTFTVTDNCSRKFDIWALLYFYQKNCTELLVSVEKNTETPNNRKLPP